MLHMQPQQAARGNTLQKVCYFRRTECDRSSRGVFASLNEECWELVSRVTGVRCTISSLHIAWDLRVKHLRLINISYTAGLL